MKYSVFLCFNFYCIFVTILKRTSGYGNRIPPTSDFEYGDSNFEGKTVIYRLIGNDMPPLQLRGQLRRNTKYALDNEPHLHGVTKRWILNRIWNNTDFEGIYGDLLAAGVKRRDIVSNCFDLKQYNSYETVEEKLFYLTAQNEGRDIGIADGHDSGFEWSVILDGNTFITKDSWAIIEKALKAGSQKKMKYMKIPYHRVHSEQNVEWLNKTTTLNTLLSFAPIKGESQLAFHRSAEENFSLGDTKPDQKDPTKPKRGYGARNKSYMFKEGAICAPESKQCQCAAVVEGNEEDEVATGHGYASECGLILRLWSYPTGHQVTTGIPADDEEGFFCYLEEEEAAILKWSTICNKIRYVVVPAWLKLSEEEQAKYRGAKANACKARVSALFLTESCIRSDFRTLAQEDVVNSLDQMTKKKYDSAQSLCIQVTSADLAKKRRHILTSFDENTLKAEADAWRDKDSSGYKAIAPLVENLIAKADSGMKLGPYSVMKKTGPLFNQSEKRYYHSVRPYYWPYDLVPKDQLEKLKKVFLKKEDIGKFVHWDGMRVPGSIIGGPGEDRNDRASAWYMMANVTNLALAWHFTKDMKYAQYATELLDVYILSDKTGMHPSLECAQDGASLGLIDWKDFYFFLDAIVLLERSGAMISAQVLKMEQWSSHLVEWYMVSDQGRQEAYFANNHGMFFDLSTLSLSLYSNDIDNIDDARIRLQYRLSNVWPSGHFSYDGTPSFEITRPTSLHYVTFNLVGWLHIASMVESIRKSNARLYGNFPSLWEMRHDNSTDKDPPVLLKAIRWVCAFLPADAKVYETLVEPKAGMGVKFPYQQEDAFAFDRMLEIVHIGVRVYGIDSIFSPKNLKEKAVQTALNIPFYSIKTASTTEFSSVYPDSGTRLWPSLGLPNHFSGGSDGAKWYNVEKQKEKR